MNLIKLSATSSTNDYLKKMSHINNVPDFTVVWALVQTNGKGQMGANWVTNQAKNLTFSVLLKGDYLSISNLFTLNVIVANSVLKALRALNLTNIYVKWPNDILSYNKKIGGILIENTISSNSKIKSIIGIGLNIDETDFESLPQASSILKNYNINVDKEALLNSIVENLKISLQNIDLDVENQWEFYHDNLFCKDKLSKFHHVDGFEFTGFIRQVNRVGQLVVELPNNNLMCYNLKEIKLNY